jgi:hypothetical protein
MGSVAPMYAAMLHFPDRKMLLNILISVLMPSVALCTYFLLTTMWFNSPVIPEQIGERTIYMLPMLASCYLIHVIVGSLCLMGPPEDKYSNQELQYMKLKILNYNYADDADKDSVSDGY